MKPNRTAIRAITVEFARQFIRPFVWVSLGILVSILLVIALLAMNLSQWWWLLMLPVVLLGLIGLAIWAIIRLITRRISPPMNTHQKIATRKFVDKLKFVVETVRTPYPLIIFYVVRDIITRKEEGFIQEVITHSKTLKPDFDELARLFS